MGIGIQAFGGEAEAEGPWTHKFQVSVFGASVSASNAADSHDPTINGAQDNLSYTLKFDGRVTWKQDKHTIDETLLLQFGQRKYTDLDWEENIDEVNYDFTYEWDKTASVKDAIWFADKIHAELQGTGVFFKVETV